VIAIFTNIGSFVALLSPYSSYGRIVSNLFAPIYQWGNNLFALIAERANSYAFYSKEVWLKSLPTFIIAAVTFVAIFILAWKGGRSYCNNICPVGSFLGLISNFSIFKIKINTDKCTGCTLCARNCKASCINPKEHKIDYSRCVACFDCIGNCNQGAISFTACGKSDRKVDQSRRKALTVAGVILATSALKAQEKVDGGLAAIQQKKVPVRKTKIVPAGAQSIKHFEDHCTGCQLCVSVCPNSVLRPSDSILSLMQPEMSYERGYCRPECTKCSEVCPAGAITGITREEKSSTKIGTAVWISENCIPLRDGVSCGNCARHCPAGAIKLVPSDPNDKSSLRVPAVNAERCIGCGTCENLCPARPFSAIYVEGTEVHRTI
ncbi:MAG: 4Fe-4S dicluster domain-containing protein, partial [Saccharofermentanales bacterium]